jgi:tetratricopeptide (TPR) repeat protein
LISFSRLRLLVCATVFVASFVAYLFTLNPAFRADDSPETITACATLGIQHPPGYPLHTLVGRLFQILPLGSPAWRGNLQAAFCGSLAAALLTALVSGLARRWQESLDQASQPAHTWTSAAAGAAAGLLLALGATGWSQSLAAKGGIYTLHLACLAGTWLLLWTWGREVEAAPQADVAALLRLRSARLSALLLGLGLGNHWETQALVLPAVGAFVGLTLWPRRRGTLPELVRSAAPLCLLAAAGAAVWAYLPLRARQAPFLNWGDPRDWKQFWWVFLRQEYLDLEIGFLKSLRAALLAGGSWSTVAENWATVQRQGLRVLAHLAGPRADLGWGAALLSALGLWVLRPAHRTLEARFSVSLISLFAVFVLVITFYFHLKPEMLWILDVFLLPAYLAQAAFAALGALWLWRRWARALRPGLALAAALALAPGLYALRAQAETQAGHYLAWDYGLDLLLSAKPNAIILAEGDFNTMPIYYLQRLAGHRPDVDHVTTVFLSTDWGVAHARRVQPRLGIGVVPKAITGARAGDAQVLRAALNQIVQANPGRPVQCSLFREILDTAVPEWRPRWRPHGLADAQSADERAAHGLLRAFRSRHLLLDRDGLDESPAFALSNYGAAILNLANQLRNEGKTTAALPYYARAVQWTTRANLAEAYTHWGIALAAGGGGLKPDLAGAERLFRKALDVKPLFEAWANLAGVCNQQGQATRQGAWFVQAEDAARKALGLNPNNAQAWNNLAIALYYQGKQAEALQALRSAAQRAPGDPQIQANLRALGAAP